VASFVHGNFLPLECHFESIKFFKNWKNRWGMIVSALSIISLIIGLIAGHGNYDSFLPIHIGTGGSIAGGLLALLFLGAYLYFSYQLLQGSTNVRNFIINFSHIETNIIIIS
jgi:hypothetical protein